MLAVLQSFQEIRGRAPASAGRHRIEHLEGQPVIAQAHLPARLAIRWAISDSIVWRICLMRRIKSGQYTEGLANPVPGL